MPSTRSTNRWRAGWAWLGLSLLLSACAPFGAQAVPVAGGRWSFDAGTLRISYVPDRRALSGGQGYLTESRWDRDGDLVRLWAEARSTWLPQPGILDLTVTIPDVQAGRTTVLDKVSGRSLFMVPAAAQYGEF